MSDAPSLAIRPLGPEDRAPWEMLFRAYMAFYERDEPQRMYDRAWLELLAGDRMHALVASLDERIVGMAHFLVHANTSLPADVCYLQDLYTDPSGRGRGVGGALIAAVVEWARQRRCARVYWTTKQDNATARRLYDRVATFRGFIRYDISLTVVIERMPKIRAAPATGLANTLRALDNDRRLQILEWLKDPVRHFRPQTDGDLVDDGVCGLLIAEKLGVSQPTVSEHMRVLVDAGIVDAKRIRQWTFYKRNEAAINVFKRSVRQTL